MEPIKAWAIVSKDGELSGVYQNEANAQADWEQELADLGGDHSKYYPVTVIEGHVNGPSAGGGDELQLVQDFLDDWKRAGEYAIKKDGGLPEGFEDIAETVERALTESRSRISSRRAVELAELEELLEYYNQPFMGTHDQLEAMIAKRKEG